MKIIQKSFYYLIAFILLYIDGIGNDEGGITIGQIWKVPVLLYLACKIIPSLKINFIKYRLFYAISKLFNADSMNNLFRNLTSNVLKFTALPLFLGYINKYIDYKKAMKYGLFIAQVIIISFIPFWLGLIDERHSYKGATLIGTRALIGPFNNSHTAAIYLSTSLLFLIHYIKITRLRKDIKYFNLFLIFIGCYFLIHTYVRTGYLMFLIGSFILLFGYKGNWIKTAIYGIIGIAMIIFVSVWMISNDSILQRRIYEKTGYNEDEDEISGSGRIYFWITAWQLWYNSKNVSGYLFGHGSSRLAKAEYLENGLHVGSHNGYLDALAQNGLVGFSLFMLYYIMMIKYMYRYRKNKHFKLFIAWLLSELAFQSVQGGVFIFYDFMSAIIILLPKLNAKVKDLPQEKHNNLLFTFQKLRRSLLSDMRN